jgi:hypothetical protein
MSQDSIGPLVEELQSQRFYGSLEIKLEAGRIVLLRKTETIKLSESDYRNNRGNPNGTANQK